MRHRFFKQCRTMIGELIEGDGRCQRSGGVFLTLLQTRSLRVDGIIVYKP
ncbi:MAG: hypothetical protein N3B10_09730 [Armatimonadetes bacterium]|nr:hypothetical protein [Armatimonadota bacterium]